MLKYAIPAAFAMLALTPPAPATAAPASSITLDQVRGATIELVAQKHHKASHHGKARRGWTHKRSVSRHRATHRRFHAGRHYRRAPAGWRRYSARPGNWRTRGCILVGPIWFCP